MQLWPSPLKPAWHTHAQLPVELLFNFKQDAWTSHLKSWPSTLLSAVNVSKYKRMLPLDFKNLLVNKHITFQTPSHNIALFSVCAPFHSIQDYILKPSFARKPSFFIVKCQSKIYCPLEAKFKKKNVSLKRNFECFQKYKIPTFKSENEE